MRGWVLGLLLLLAPVCAYAQLSQTYMRTFEADGHFYVIEYFVGSNADVRGPSTLRAQPHYAATIQVFEVLNGRRMLIAKPFGGIWTPDGCFEDEPQALVKQAYELAKGQEDSRVKDDDVWP
jgi:hypothetical protein